jgi:uncharacterized protein
MMKGVFSLRIVSTYPVISFVALTYVISWSLWLPQVLYSQGYIAAQIPFWGLGSFGPSIAGIVVIYLFSGSNGLKELWIRLRDWKLALKWYGFILLFPSVIIMISFSINHFLGGSMPPINLKDSLPLIVPTFLLVLFLGGPLNEELGWRGFLLPRLLSVKAPFAASIILGVIWALWHLPLFWIQGASQEGIPVIWVLLQIMALSIIFTWLYRRTEGSLLIALLFHASLNTSGVFLPILPAMAGSTQPYLITVILALGFAGFLAIITRGEL